MATSSPCVFISYQRADDAFAHAVREHLAAHGVRTWMDQYDIPVGAYWPDEIDKGLANASIVVGVLSPDSAESRNVKNEWDWAIANHRPLVLIQTAPCVIPHRYVSINYIDATRDPDVALRQLASALAQHGSVVALPLAGSAIPVHSPSSVQSLPTEESPASPQPGESFFGREREVAETAAILHDALAGQRQLLLLAGEPGIGKTRLAEELTTMAERRGARVCWGRCFEWEGAPAFWPWVEVLRAYAESVDPDELRAQFGGGAPFIAQLGPEVATILGAVPKLPPMNPEQARFRLFDAVARFLQAASANRPLVIVLDDLHWADEASLQLLEFVARELKRAPLLLVGTYRDIEVRRDHPLARSLTSMARTAEPRRISLKGVPAESVPAFVRELTGVEPVAALVKTIHEGTEGNPFFISEVVRLLRAEGQLAEATTGMPLHLRVPESVREVVGRRLSRLPEASNEVLLVASVIGRDFSIRLLQDVSRSTVDALLEAIEDGVDARLVDELEPVGHYRFSHALVRQTLYEELRTARRVRLHGQVGEALERLYASDPKAHASELAYHFTEAAPAGYAEQAITYATQAAERAMGQFAWEAAIQQYELGLQVLDLLEQPNPQQEIELLLALGEAQNRIAAGRHRSGAMELGAGGSPSGLRTFWRAAERARAAGTPEQLARAALGVVGFNPYPQQGGLDGVQLLEEALERLPQEDSALKVRLLARLGVDTQILGYFSIQLTLTDDVQARIRERGNAAVAMARRIGDPGTVAYALVMRSILGLWYAPENRLTDAEAAIEAATAGSDRVMLAWGLREKAHALEARGEILAFNATLDEFARVAQELRLPFFLWHAAIAYANRAMVAGRLEEAARFVDDADDIQPVSGAGTLVRVALYREWERTDELLPLIDRIRAWRSPIVLASRIACQLDIGDVEGARDDFAALAAAGFVGQGIGHRTLALLAELCARLGGAEHALALYDVLGPMANRMVLAESSDKAGSASYYLGLLATTLARWDDAERHFAEALKMNEHWGFRLHVAYTQYAWADMLARRNAPGDRYHALDMPDPALALAREIGATRLVRTATELHERLRTPHQ